jgi:hypothetical protein
MSGMARKVARMRCNIASFKISLPIVRSSVSVDPISRSNFCFSSPFSDKPSIVKVISAASPDHLSRTEPSIVTSITQRLLLLSINDLVKHSALQRSLSRKPQIP